MKYAVTLKLRSEVIDRRDGKVKGRSDAAGLNFWCSTLRHFVFVHFLYSSHSPLVKTDISP